MKKAIKDKIKGKKLGKVQKLGNCCREVRLCCNAQEGPILTGYNTREHETGYEEWIVIKECRPKRSNKHFYEETIVQKLI